MTEDGKSFDYNELNIIISKWLSGQPLSSFNPTEEVEEIIADLFAFKLPWLFNAIAKKLRVIEMDDDAEIIEELSMLIEVGLPNLTALKVYQAGIRSRISAYELSLYFDDELWSKSIKDYKNDIILHKEFYKLKVSESCKEWIDLLFHFSNTKIQSIDRIPLFRLKAIDKGIRTLIAKEINGKQHLVSPDYSYIKEIDSTIDFSTVNKMSGIYFQYEEEDDTWRMEVENPYIQIRDDRFPI